MAKSKAKATPRAKEKPKARAKRRRAPATRGGSPRAIRVALVRTIEQARRSRVISYICGDRQGSSSQIGEDAIRPMYDHIRRIGHADKIDLFLYSRGGAVEVPWRIVTMLREHCNKLAVLIPYRAHSAATLIALGCDEIVMGRKAELGPIDPALNIAQDPGTAVKEAIRVEDVMSYIRFIKEVAGLGDQQAIADNVRLLSEKLSPWIIGSIHRIHTHIRMLARKMLDSHATRVDEQAASVIVESLAERIYSHGHAIGRSEAKDLGLPIKEPTKKQEDVLWSLLERYEDMLLLRHPIDPNAVFSGQEDTHEMPTLIAAIESREMTSAFRGVLSFKRVRKTPDQVNVNLNAGISLPPGLDPKALPKALAEEINRALRELQRQAPGWVREQARVQSPVTRIEGKLRGAHWQDITREGL